MKVRHTSQPVCLGDFTFGRLVQQAQNEFADPQYKPNRQPCDRCRIGGATIKQPEQEHCRDRWCQVSLRTLQVLVQPLIFRQPAHHGNPHQSQTNDHDGRNAPNRNQLTFGRLRLKLFENIQRKQ